MSQKSKDTTILVVVGTVREGSYTLRVAKFIHNRVQAQGHTALLADLAELNLPPLKDKNDPAADSWRQLVKQSDGIIFVVPEYNHSFPGALKDALDYDYTIYENIPVGIVSVSKGAIAGARMVEHLIPLLVNFGMLPIKQVVSVANVRDIVDDQEKISNEGLIEKIDSQINSVSKLSLALRSVK